MYSVEKTFSFSASHQLTGLPAAHPCSRLHGHNYRVKVILIRYDLDNVGFVVDYRNLDPFKRYLDREVDHRHLNEVFPSINPTAENLARLFFDEVRRYVALVHEWLRVEVSETDKTWASYEDDTLLGDPTEEYT